VRHRVLLVDDVAAYRRVVAALLEDVADVLDAPSVEEAERLLAAEHVDAVLCDLHLGAVGPREALRRVRGVAGPTPVIALSGADLAAEALQAGAAGFVLKGDEREVLPVLLERLLGAPDPVPPAPAAAPVPAVAPGRRRSTLLATIGVLALAGTVVALDALLRLDAPASAAAIALGAVAVVVLRRASTTQLARGRAERRLAGTAEELRVLMATAPVGVMRLDPGGRPTFVNARLRQLLGTGVEDDPGTWVQLVHPQDRRRVLELHREARDTGRDFGYAARVVRRDGRVLHVEVSCAALRDAAGALTGWVGTVDDVTARRSAERQAAQTRHRLEAILDNAATPIFLKDLHGRYLLANRATGLVFGRAPEDLVGATDEELLPADVAAELVRHDREALEEGGPVVREEQLDAPGGPRSFSTVKFPVLDADGLVLGVGGVATDLTPYRRATAALDAERSLLAEAEDLARLGSFRMDLASGRLELSDALVCLLALDEPRPATPEALVAAVVVPEDRERTLAAVDRAIAHAGGFDLICRARPADQERVLRLRGRSTAGTDDPALVGVVQDVTDAQIGHARLVVAESRLRAIVDRSPVGLAIVGPDDALRVVNPALEELLDEPRGLLLGRPLDALAHAGDRDADAPQLAALREGRLPAFEVEKRLVRRDGTVLRARLAFAALPAGETVLQVVDVSAQRRLEDRLRLQASTDPLTGLLNRRGLEAVLREPRRTGSALVLVDLDDFRSVVEHDGHAAGNVLLRAVGEALADAVPQGVVARLDADEFAVVAPADAADLEGLVGRLRRAVTAVRRPDGTPLTAGAGAALVQDGDVPAAVARADAALQAGRHLPAGKVAGG
jgi:PAS domain S-box-containing protein/diguanylate cyclase (GGDEF)-like protein